MSIVLPHRELSEDRYLAGVTFTLSSAALRVNWSNSSSSLARSEAIATRGLRVIGGLPESASRGAKPPVCTSSSSGDHALLRLNGKQGPP
eukprot:526623-Amphidinium_carterae.1